MSETGESAVTERESSYLGTAFPRRTALPHMAGSACHGVDFLFAFSSRVRQQDSFKSATQAKYDLRAPITLLPTLTAFPSFFLIFHLVSRSRTMPIAATRQPCALIFYLLEVACMCMGPPFYSQRRASSYHRVNQEFIRLCFPSSFSP